MVIRSTSQWPHRVHLPRIPARVQCDVDTEIHEHDTEHFRDDETGLRRVQLLKPKAV